MIESFGGHTPVVHPTAFVHDSAQVIGEVSLAARSSVWPTAVLRGDMGAIHIGEDSNLQDGVVAHMTDDLSTVEIGRRVTVGHRAILHGCRVGDGSLIGMGSILLDNAVIGEDCLVGAGALVPAERVIPPRSLVLGMPARVVRPLREDELEWMRYSWSVYVERASTWLAGR